MDGRRSCLFCSVELVVSQWQPITVVETPEFLSAARGLMADEERMALVDYLASHPLSGDLIVGSGGVRKLRWALRGRGKRGGARIIYFVHDPGMPLFVLTVYAKNLQATLSQAEINVIRELTHRLIAAYRKGR